jgi:hypothetical protein
MRTLTPIQVLQPNVSQVEAVSAFRSAGLGGIYWRMRSGPLQRIADAYVPFLIYRVRYRLGRAVHARNFAIDLVDGSLDLFEFAKIPGREQLISIETRNSLQRSLRDEDADRLLRDKVLRVVFQEGFFKLSEPQIDIIREETYFHLPYWLAFYGQRTARCRVMDAVRRRIEGAKASAFFEEWLTA